MLATDLLEITQEHFELVVFEASPSDSQVGIFPKKKENETRPNE